MALLETSFFSDRTTEDLYRYVQEVYKNYDYPWVIGYSGGKDSTATLQVIWNAIRDLPKEDRTKKIFVISTDTLVETPVIVDYINDNLDRINEAAKIQGLPFSAHKLSPALQDTFWVNLIGKGYPAPNSNFRWCTDRMKIKPSNKFILEKAAEYGEVILALGMRRGESNNRDKVMKSYRLKGHNLSRHSQLPGAWVFMPIEDFTINDVWTYLLQHTENGKSPWGGDNRSLSALYRSAQEGECPLVIDKTSPSCGNSRFGCWTCTVVARDKSMENMIDSGHEWMIPLLDFRDWLASTQSTEDKASQREYKGRDGRVKVSKGGKLRYRTYKIDFSKEMLKRLLETQEEVQEHDPEFELISIQELREIRKLWISERQDWQDSLPEIYESVVGKPLVKDFSDLPLPGMTELALLEELSQKYDVPLRLPQKLLDAEWQTFGMFKRTKIHQTIDKIFNEDWRSLEDVQEDILEMENDETNSQ
ncbi:MAG: DNA phosphorothioation system sulfurtransferase DndC [Bacteroidota bacterium]